MHRRVVCFFAVASLAGATTLRGQTTARETRAAAARDTSLRIVVSIAERRLRVLEGERDTLLVARVAVGSDGSITYQGHHWVFDTPRGIHAVVDKDSAPMWVPPDWHFIEVARQEHLKLVWLRGDTTISFDDGSRLVVDHRSAQFIDDRGPDPFKIGEHIVVDDVLYVPVIGSESRRIPGELGEFRLSIGDGVGIHGTPDAASIGNAVTHGCVRLGDSDIAWLYHHVTIGAGVYIY